MKPRAQPKPQRSEPRGLSTRQQLQARPGMRRREQLGPHARSDRVNTGSQPTPSLARMRIGSQLKSQDRLEQCRRPLSRKLQRCFSSGLVWSEQTALGHELAIKTYHAPSVDMGHTTLSNKCVWIERCISIDPRHVCSRKEIGGLSGPASLDTTFRNRIPHAPSKTIVSSLS
jgi:hypothetical protein